MRIKTRPIKVLRGELQNFDYFTSEKVEKEFLPVKAPKTNILLKLNPLARPTDHQSYRTGAGKSIGIL